MKWTYGIPDKPGWWWCRDICLGQHHGMILYVELRCDELLVHGLSLGQKRLDDIPACGFQWAGPLSEPEEE